MRWILGTAVLAAGIGAANGLQVLGAQSTPEPQVLYWEQNAQPNTGTAVGLLYTPEVLSALTSRISADAVPRSIADAIQQRTPVVAMWEASGAVPQPQPPYQLAIVSDRGGSDGAVQALWTQQRAGDLAKLDSRFTSTEERVAAIAAFPASAFVPGHRVLLRSARQKIEVGSNTWHQRWGVIRWDGRSAAR